MPRSSRAAVAKMSKAEGDRIARLVLQLVQSIAADPTIHQHSEPEPVGPSPVYRDFQRLVEGPRAS